VTLLRDLIRRQSAATETHAAEAMITEALADPNGRLASDLRQVGVLPPPARPGRR
jgi:hypothetical protein